MSPRAFWWVALLATALGECQPYFPIYAGTQVPIMPPAITASGNSVVFGSSFSASGVPGSPYNVCTVNTDGSGFRQLTNAANATPYQGINSISLTADGRWAGYTANLGGLHEEVHLLNVSVAPAAGSDRTLYVDTQGCVIPLAICVGCAPYTCLRTPHVSDDGSAILVAQSGTPAFLLAKSDGSAPVNLPIYSGTLAASGHRVISSKGQVVFTSSAPSSPVSSQPQVYVMNLDGSNLRPVTQFTDTSVYPQEATISADGSLIAFTVPVPTLASVLLGTPASGTSTLYTIRSDGYQFSAVAAGAVSSPSLSADGTLLSYIDGGQVVVLTLGPPQVRKVLTQLQYSAAQDATISDDGTRVGFTLGPPVVYGVYDPLVISLPEPVNTVLAPGPAAVYSAATGGGRLGVATIQAAYAPRYVDPPLAAAGSLATALATNLTSDTAAFASSLPLPQTLAGVSLLLNGHTVPLISVNPWGIQYQVPPDASTGIDVLQPEFADGTVATSVIAHVVAILPNIIYVASSQAAVFHGNTGTLVDSTHPAVAGEVLVMYASGLGPTNPVVPAGTGAPANPPALTVNQPLVNIGNASIQAQFSGLAPGMVGVYQINFVLPSGLSAGGHPIDITAAGETGAGGYLYVK